jgi:hypothetical protein
VHAEVGDLLDFDEVIVNLNPYLKRIMNREGVDGRGGGGGGEEGDKKVLQR